YSLIGTCKLNGVEPESYLRYVLDVISPSPGTVRLVRQ
ncbi:transposase domain-containing protein, partial [Escherichia coli]